MVSTNDVIPTFYFFHVFKSLFSISFLPWPVFCKCSSSPTPYAVILSPYSDAKSPSNEEQWPADDNRKHFNLYLYILYKFLHIIGNGWERNWPDNMVTVFYSEGRKNSSKIKRSTQLFFRYIDVLCSILLECYAYFGIFCYWPDWLQTEIVYFFQITIGETNAKTLHTKTQHNSQRLPGVLH